MAQHEKLTISSWIQEVRNDKKGYCMVGCVYLVAAVGLGVLFMTAPILKGGAWLFERARRTKTPSHRD